MLNVKKGSVFSKVIASMLTFLMCFSSCSNLIFADEPVVYGGWTVTNDGTSSGVAVFEGMDLTYVSPSSQIIKYGEATIDGVSYTSVRSNSSNGAANGGIVTIDNNTRGYIKYVPEKDGTFTTWIGSAPTKLMVVSKTNNETNESTAIGSFNPCGTDDTINVIDKNEMEVIQEKNYATLNIEVKAGYTYYYCVTGSKMGCYGGKFVPYTKVTGTINDEYNISDFGLKFTNSETKEVFNATVDAASKTYSISLKPGYTYSAGLTGSSAASYGISKDTRSISPKGESMVSDITIEQSTNFTVSGSISGIADGYNKEDFGLTFVPKDINDFVSVDAEIDKTNMTYSAILVANEEYTLVQSGAFDYELAEEIKVSNEDDKAVVKDVAFKDVATFDVSGKFLGLTQERGVYQDLTSVEPTQIKFTNITDKYKYEYSYDGTPAAGSYSAKLRKGDYIAEITCQDYSTTTHVVVDNANVSRDLLLKYEGAVEVPFADTVYVGKDKDYKTVSAAVEAVSKMTRVDDKRVTIKIDPGVYREQVYVTVPNITFESNGGNKDNTKITWYYGIGYKYYSCVASIYSPYADYDKYSKGDVKSYWGGAVITTKDAQGFNAKDICFENSFNKYMTDDEISDGVEVNGQEAITTVRKETTVVDSRAATERAAALVNYADKTEFLNCSFIGSQDTLYTCNVGYKAYYKNCYIEGMTDFIYGNGDVIFDGCELNWCGYSDTKQGGYLTAQSASDNYDVEYGYVFRNCFISKNKERLVASGDFGRMWGKYATVNFINTQLESADLINDAGWNGGMNPLTLSTLKIKEFNTTFNGEKVDTSNRAIGAVDTIDADIYTVSNMFIKNNWTPNYYVAESSETPEIVEGPAFTSNGDINAPNPGETLTVNYKLTDGCNETNTSRIAWYAVSTDFDATSLETILKSATLLGVTTSYSSNNKYQIPMDCAGKYIMAVVTPITVGGKEGTAKYEIDTTKAVSDTWINPDNQGEIAPGSGINIFLAGDSTVKDYSAKGMYQGGKINNLGSWGEFFQNFFNSDAVTVNNYANGGRSLRNFLNEGSLDKIKANISEGDFLFIQFGHNDCANGSSYYNDRFVPLYAKPNGTDVVDGIYPTVLPEESMKGSDGKYAWDCGATYKGYMQYYINSAIEAGAIPVIVSPVARMYYNADGTIKPHHDATATDYAPTSTYKTSGNAYVTACKQLYEENLAKGNTIYYIDAFDMTKTMFEDAWKAGNSNVNGLAMMGGGGDSTHCNKVGGVLEAGLIAQAVQNLGISASKYVVQPTTAYGETASGEYIFTIKNKQFTALNNDFVQNSYVTEFGQKLFDAIGNSESLDVEYTVSGKTNLTGGTLNVTDADGKAVASTEIKEDGTYSFKIASSSSIADKIYKAKVRGYAEVTLKLTVSESDATMFTAEDVTFEVSGLSGIVGDADGDGVIDVNDASLVLEKVLNEDTVLPIEAAEGYMKLIDVDKDDNLTSVDAAMILKRALDESFEF